MAVLESIEDLGKGENGLIGIVKVVTASQMK